MENLKITSIEDIKNGSVIELPGFYDDTPFVVRAKRPSLLDMIATGEMPNELLNRTYSLFYGEDTTSKKSDEEKVEMLQENAKVYTEIAKRALIEPSYEQLKEAGISLTDTQLLDLWNFSQLGVRALKSFRDKQQNTKNTKNK